MAGCCFEICFHFSRGLVRMVDRASVVALAVVSTCFFWRSFTLVSVQTEFHLDFTSFEFSCSFGEFHCYSMDIGDDIWEEGANLSSADGDDWTVVEGEVVNLDRSSKSHSHRLTPQCKSQPLAAPQYRCDLASSRMDHRGRTVPPVGGLARPSLPQRPQQDSISYAVGLPVPMCQVAIPRSLQIPDCADDVTVAEHVHDVQSYALPSSGKRQRRQSKIPVQSDTGPIDLVRTKRASDSPLVQSLWDMIINLYVLHSPLLQQIQHSAFRREHFARLIDNFAASTLVKYLSALQVFHSLLTDMRIHLAGLSELQLADILVAGRLSKHSEGATASPSILIKAVRWGFKRLRIDPFSVAFGPLIASFQMKVPKDRRESLPFSLYILTQFERHILVRETSREDVLILGSYMLLLFSGLRFADMQRTAPSSLQWDGTSLRGLAWRTKTSCAGTPFGALACGFLSQGSYNWLFKFLVHLDGVLAEAGIADIDFLVPSIGPEGIRAPLRPMSYAESLFFLRHFLRLPWKKSPLDLGIAPQSYTIHGLKSTLISWATQLDLPDEHKRLQGKHQSRNSSTRLYSRDDVHGALSLQKAVVKAVHEGWKPVTPLSRGGQLPLVEPLMQLERFNKQAPDHTWQFLKFQSHDFAVPEEDAALPHEAADAVEASSSSDSDSSSSDSSSSEVPEPQKTVQSSTNLDEVDEVLGALHRNTWHVMLAKSWRGNMEVIQTACGRFFDVAHIQAVHELELKASQALCGHPGCRKGWLAVGAQ